MGRLAFRCGLGFVLAAPATWLACSSFDGGDTPLDDAGTVGSQESGPKPDTDATPPVEGFPDFSSGANWSQFNLQSIAPGQGWLGVGFDGRYLYFSPSGTVVARYDTQKEFTAPASWEIFDVATIGVKGDGPALGAVFDGRWVYFAPHYNHDPIGRFAYRYDTKATFGSKQAWEIISFDSFGDGGISAASGVVFDGHLVSVVPYEKPLDGGNPQNAFAAFDPTTGTFTQAASWTVKPIPKTDGGAVVDYTGAALLDGGIFSGSALGPRLTRTSSDLTEVTSFDTTATAGVKTGTYGSISDGRFVYVTPFLVVGLGAENTGLVRHDTTQDLDASGSYERFDLKSISADLKAFTGGTYDGRYVYLTPWFRGKFVRYDTQKAFSEGASYDVFDSTPITGSAPIFRAGAAFDGKYVYFPPANGGSVLRFRARDLGGSWPATTSSF